MSASLKIALVGATGGLGRAIFEQASARGHAVTAVVRDVEKARSMFPGAMIDQVSVEDGHGLVEAFQGHDCVIEVVSNSLRPHGVAHIIAASESAQVPIFVACGGAGCLMTKEGSDAIRLCDAPGLSFLKNLTQMHLGVQSIAFASSIPTVMQICPPSMSDGALTSGFKPSKNISHGVQSASYSDFASVLLLSLESPLTYNRSMIGLNRI